MAKLICENCGELPSPIRPEDKTEAEAIADLEGMLESKCPKCGGNLRIE
jgi:hypothetical protein